MGSTLKPPCLTIRPMGIIKIKHNIHLHCITQRNQIANSPYISQRVWWQIEAKKWVKREEALVKSHIIYLRQLTSFTSTAAVCAPCTSARDHADRSLCASTRNTCASTPWRVPDRVPKVKSSACAPVDSAFVEVAGVCLPQCTSLLGRHNIIVNFWCEMVRLFGINISISFFFNCWFHETLKLCVHV